MGLPLALGTQPEAYIEIAKRASLGHAIAVANAQVLVLSQASPFKEWMCAHDIIFPESAPVTTALKICHGTQTERVYGPKLMDSTLRAYPHKTHFILGRDEETLALLRRKYELKPHQTFATKNHVEDDHAIDAAIRESNAEILWCGLGTPSQQQWCAENRGRWACTLVGVGYALAANAGTASSPPEWALKTGTGWVFRFIDEPRRLGRRYLTHNPLFILLAIKELLKRKKNH